MKNTTLSNYLLRVYNEVPFDIALSSDLDPTQPEHQTYKILLYKGAAPTKKMIKNIKQSGKLLSSVKINDKFLKRIGSSVILTPVGIENLLKPLIDKKMISPLGVHYLISNHPNGIEVFDNHIELDIVNANTINVIRKQ